MFTGIVEDAGEVAAVEDAEGGRRLRIGHEFDELRYGQSISVSGVCLTVEEYTDEWFEVFLAEETVERTYLGAVEKSDAVNLERALAADGRFDGHLVQGHVDGTCEVVAVDRVGGAERPSADRSRGEQPREDGDWRFAFSLPPQIGRYVVEKGSVALDGISLTVADRADDRLEVAVIPTTYDLTTLSEKAVGDPVHVEVDVIAKYVERLVEGYQ